MLAYNKRPHSSLTQFMQYISHSHDLESILLQVIPFTLPPLTEERCQCGSERKCRCVVLWATEEIMIMLAHRLPGTLKRLPGSRCLLPSVFCLKNGCHGCNRGLLYVDDLRDVEVTGESSEPATSERRLTEDDPRVDSPAAVCEALEDFTGEEESSCIFIPIHAGNADRWTKFMIKFLKSKEKEAKGIKVMASKALEKYTTQSTQELRFSFPTRTGGIVVTERYESASLILPRVAEVLVNIVLTGWLRLDGFSSSLVSRRAIRDYLVDSTGTGFAANAFLTEAAIFCSGDGSNVGQLLRFRGGLLSARRVSYIVGCVNVFCSIAWSVLIACEGNWAPSMPLSTPRLAVILGAVGVALGMDCFEFCWAPVRAQVQARAWVRVQDRDQVRARALARALARARVHEARVQVLTQAEEAEAEADAEAWAQTPAQVQAQAQGLSPALAEAQAQAQAWAKAQALARAQAEAEAEAKALDRAQTRDRGQARFWGLGAGVILEVGCIVSLVVSLIMKVGLGRWEYSVMQVLVWVKWGIGSFLLGDMANEDELVNVGLRIQNIGTWVYCSAFLLNAMLAGVRRKWVYYL